MKLDLVDGWNLSDLVQAIREELKKPDSEEFRLRRYNDKTFLYLDDLEKDLRKLWGFDEIETWVIVEPGRMPTDSEFVLSIQFDKDRSNVKDFYFGDDWTVDRCKK